MKRKRVAEDVLLTAYELFALADLIEPLGDHCWTREGAEGLAIILRRMAKRLRRRSDDIEMEEFEQTKEHGHELLKSSR